MRRVLSSQRNLTKPGGEKTAYGTEDIFKVSNINRSGLNKLRDKPLQRLRNLFKLGVLAQGTER